jgi:hypothetical protein
MTLVKDLAWADSMEALRRELHRQETIEEVARALNAAAVLAPWKPRGVGVRVWQWRGDYIRSIISDPLYYGEPSFMTSEPGSVWNQFREVDSEFDPRKLTWHLPELAWWTRDEATAWEEKFTQSYVRGRNRKHQHLLLGLLACQTCGQELRKQGLDRSGGRYYSCPGYGKHPDDVGYCPKAQFLMESSAFRVLREQVVTRLAETVNIQAVLSRATSTLPESLELAVAHQQLELLLEREQSLLAMADERCYGRQLKQLLQQLGKEKHKLELEVAARERAQAIFVDTVAGLAGSAKDLVAYYDAQTEEHKAAIVRLLIRRVTLPTNWQRGAAHKFLNAEWVPLVDLATR